MKKLTTMISGESTALDPVNTFVKIDQFAEKEVVRVTKDPKVQAVDEPTFAKLIDSDFKNGQAIGAAMLYKALVVQIGTTNVRNYPPTTHPMLCAIEMM